MSNQHKNPTISFRITDAERKQIEARILASGMMKKDYFIRSCIYNRICVVGKKETIYPLVQTVNALYLQLLEMQKAFTATGNTSNTLPSSEAIKELQKDEFIRKVLGGHISEKYIAAKWDEWHRYYPQVSQWEIQEYLYRY